MPDVYRAPSPSFSYSLPSDNVGQFFAGPTGEPCNFPAGTQPPVPGATADLVVLDSDLAVTGVLRQGSWVIEDEDVSRRP